MPNDNEQILAPPIESLGRVRPRGLAGLPTEQRVERKPIPFIPTTPPTPSPQDTANTEKEYDNFFVALGKDILGLGEGVLSAVRLVAGYTVPMIYRSLFWSPEDRRQGIYTIGFQDVAEGIYDMITDDNSRREAFNTMAQNAAMIRDTVIPVWNWRNPEGKWDPIDYARRHPGNMLLDATIIGSATVGAAKAAAAAGAKASVVNAITRVGRTLESLPTLPIKGVPPALQKVGKTLEDLKIVRPGFGENIGNLHRIIATKFLQTPVAKMLLNQRYAMYAATLKRNKELADAIEGINRFKVPDELQPEVIKFFTNAHEDTAKTKQLFMQIGKMSEQQWAAFNEAIQIARERVIQMTDRLVQEGHLDRATADAIAVDIPIRFNKEIQRRLKADPNLKITDDEIRDFTALEPVRQHAITKKAQKIMEEMGRTPVYFPTHIVDEELPVIAAVNYMKKRVGDLRTEMARNERIITEGAEGAADAIEENEALKEEVAELNNRIERFKTDFNRAKIRDEANRFIRDENRRRPGAISTAVFKPTSALEQLITDLNKLPGFGYRDANALIVGELARRTFGFPFHYSLGSALSHYMNNMLRYLTDLDWHNWIASNAGKPLVDGKVHIHPLQGLSREEITARVNKGFVAYSPQVMQNLMRLYAQVDTRFLKNAFSWDTQTQELIRSITEDLRSAKITTEEFQAKLSQIFGRHSASGIATNLREFDLAQMPQQMMDQIHELQNTARISNWYLVSPEVANTVIWSLPRPSLFDLAIRNIPIVRSFVPSFDRIWVLMVLSNPRFLLNNLFGHMVFYSMMPVGASYIGRGMRARNTVAEIIERANRQPLRPIPQDVFTTARNQAFSMYDNTLGYFMRWADNMDKVAAQGALSAALLSDPEVKAVADIAKLSGRVANDGALLEFIRELADTKTLSQTIVGELTPEITKLSESIKTQLRTLHTKSNAVVAGSTRSAINEVTRQFRRIKQPVPRNIRQQVAATLDKQFQVFQDALEPAIVNIETQITDTLRTYWTHEPKMSHIDFVNLVRQVYGHLLKEDVLRTFIQATMPEGFGGSVALSNLAAMQDVPPLVRTLLSQAAVQLRMNVRKLVEAQRNLMTLGKHITPSNNIISRMLGGSPLATVQGVRIEVPLLDLTPIIRERLSIVPNQMLLPVLENMRGIALKNPIILYGMTKNERRMLFDIALTPSPTREAIIKALEDTLARHEPLVAKATGIPADQIMRNAIQHMKEWVYFTGNVNPVIRYMLAGWVPFYGFASFMAPYIVRNVLFHPQELMLYGRFGVLAQEFDTGNDDPLLKNRVLIGRDSQGNGIYASIGGLDPQSQTRQLIESLRKGDFETALADQVAPLIKSVYTMIRGRALPSLQPIADGELIYLSNGRAVRWNAAEQVMERNAGLSLADRVEVGIESYLRQFPVYELAEDIIKPYQKQPYRFFWNASPRYRLSSDGKWQIVNYPYWHYLARLSGFTVRGQQDIEDMRRLLEIHKRQTIRELQRNIRRAKTPEERAHWQEVLDQWLKSGLKIR